MKKSIFVRDGDYTNVIYQTIQDGHYYDALNILRDQLTRNPQSRACLSLLAHCYFNTQDFVSAASCYEQLCKLCPQESHYKLYNAYSQYQASNYEKAIRILSSLDDPTFQKKVVKLKAAIKYGEGDVKSTRSFLDQIKDRDPDLIINEACILYKEGKYREALGKFTAALSAEGYNPHLSYNMALCYYKLKEFAPALKHIADIIERGIREHPELSVGMATEGIGVPSVGNTLILHETALIEAFNLKAAIEYHLTNLEAAKEALTDMPPRSEEELDAVTLHNQALINMQERPADGFEKLVFLLQQNPFPPECFSNLLLLYCKYEYFNLAADVLAENAHLTNEYLTPYIYGFIDAMIIKQTRPDDAYKKFDELAERHAESLRKATKQVQEARMNQDDEAIKKAVADYEDSLEKYIPVLMAQAKIYWDLEQYNQVENIFHKSVEFCNENDTWRLHVANVLFMQDNKYKEATGFYEPIVKKYYNNLLAVAPIVLANLCVSYIMSSMNEEAEELMRKIEKEEERLRYEDPSRKVYHLSTVNLVIGTLYCAKGNYDFGINRLIWSLEPFERKLGTDTWFYAKRCILSLIENLTKRTLVASESLLKECVQFTDKCESFGGHIMTTIQSPLDDFQIPTGKNTVTCEARVLKSLLIAVNEI